MILKFGKPFDLKRINRNLNGVKKNIELSRASADKYHKSQVIDSNIKCRLCGNIMSAGGGWFVNIREEYHYYRCSECGAIVLADLPDIEKMYSGDDASGNSASYIDDAIYAQRVAMISAPKVEFVLDALERNNIIIKQWTDIGCGGGEILSYIGDNRKDINPVGIESDMKEIEFARRKNLQVHNAYIDVTEENSFVEDILFKSDVVSMFNVLEHIENPGAFVEYLWKHMHADSVIVFEVPRHPSAASFANQTHPELIYRHIVPPIHLQVFSEKSLDYMLNGKFEIFAKWYFGQGYTDLINNAMLTAGLEESSLYLQLMELSNQIQQIFDEAGLADQILAVAKKI